MNLLVYSCLSFVAAAISVGVMLNDTKASGLTSSTFLILLLRSKITLLVLINFGYACLILFGKLLQIIFFGKIRDIEYRNMYDRLIQYIIFKSVFVAAIQLDEPFLFEILLWLGWFSILGFMKLFSGLARDRFEYITTFNPNAKLSVHVKIFSLLLIILFVDLCWFYFCIFQLTNSPASFKLLLTFECFALFMDTIQTLIKYTIHLIDIYKNSSAVWEQRGTYIYYTEFVTDTLILVATLGHYIQIFYLYGVSITLIDAVLFLHMRMVFNNLKSKIVSYRNYRKLAHNIKTLYKDVSMEELRILDDICAVCHDKMTDNAKKLPCGHIFHQSCLRSCLEHHHFCPTCRYSLIENQPSTNGNTNAQRELFRFNGRRWLSWLPSFQVVHRNYGNGNNGNNGNNINNFGFGYGYGQAHAYDMGFGLGSVPPEMVQQVREIFPDVPQQDIVRDLLQTRSAEQTIENIVEGRLIYQPVRTAPSQSSNNNPSVVPSQTTNTTTNTQTFHSTSMDTQQQSPKVVSEVKSFPGTFASSPKERHSSLVSRKQALLEQARKQYLEKQPQTSAPNQETDTLQSSNANDSETRRRVLLDAINKRTTNQN